jgi:hypothetical protein
MKKIQVFLADRQTEILKEKAGEIGISLSEMIRRIVDNTINQDFTTGTPLKLKVTTISTNE